MLLPLHALCLLCHTPLCRRGGSQSRCGSSQSAARVHDLAARRCLRVLLRRPFRVHRPPLLRLQPLRRALLCPHALLRGCCCACAVCGLQARQLRRLLLRSSQSQLRQVLLPLRVQHQCRLSPHRLLLQGQLPLSDLQRLAQLVHAGSTDPPHTRVAGCVQVALQLEHLRPQLVSLLRLLCKLLPNLLRHALLCAQVHAQLLDGTPPRL